MRSPKLTPAMRALLEAMEAQGAPPLEQMSVPDARASALQGLALAGDPEPVAHVSEQLIPVRGGEAGVRIYRPDGDGPFPGLVYFHGGGWVICDLDTHDPLCRAIANRAGAVVVSVDYRRAPEHTFPTALDDCHEATRWVAAHAATLGIDPERLAVGGDSAGANMAAVIAVRCHDAGGPPLALQVLVYPPTDLTSFDTPSYREFGHDHFLTIEATRWFVAQYLARPEDARHPEASPAFIENLRGLPRALVITAECDPLCDESEAFGRRLEAAGVPVTISRYPGVIHAFLGMLGAVAEARQAVDEIAAAVRAMPAEGRMRRPATE